MSPLSRREFGRFVLAGVPLAAAARALEARTVRGLTLGVSTDSFRDFPRVQGRDNVDDVIRALQAVKATHVDLAMANVEPAPPSTGPFMGGSNAYPRRIVLSPDQVLSTNAAARGELREWRLGTPVTFFESVRSRFAAAGITLHACSLKYDDTCTDEEIVATFRQAAALGASTITSPMTLATAARLVTLAAGHPVTIAIHTQPGGNTAGAITMTQVPQALRLSPALRLKLDIGHIAASNGDALADARAYQDRVALVALRDRLRNGGASQPFGEGDTPIVPVLRYLAAASTPIPAFIEYDYVGLRTPVDEVASALAYIAHAID